MLDPPDLVTLSSLLLRIGQLPWNVTPITDVRPSVQLKRELGQGILALDEISHIGDVDRITTRFNNHGS